MNKKKILKEQMERMMSFGDTKLIVEKQSLLMNVAVQINQLRMRKGLTQRQLAEKAGVPQSTVARVESGEFGVGLYTIGKFLSALNAEIKIVENNPPRSKKEKHLLLA